MADRPNTPVPTMADTEHPIEDAQSSGASEDAVDVVPRGVAHRPSGAGGGRDTGSTCYGAETADSCHCSGYDYTSD